MESYEKYSKDWLIAEGENAFILGFVRGLTLPPKQTLSKWADENRKLSPESSAEVGDWNTSRAEYQRGIMDAISDIEASEVTIMTSSQIGKTEIMNNAVGFFVDRDPSPILFLQPTLELAESWSEDRFSPMIRDTPCLKNKVCDSKTRNSDGKKLHKVFPGGHITMAGANSPASLASRPIRILICDEVDRYPYSAGAEGDPVDLARVRTKTFWNKKIITASTPTIKGVSRIEKLFNESDQRYYYVPCPHCGEYQKLMWKNVKWENDDPETAHYMCDHCAKMLNDVERWNAISKGKWIATKEFNGHAGFWLWEGYSPWVKLSDIVSDFYKKKAKGSESLKVFVNTSLAECWEDKGERIDDNFLLSRRENYEDIAPADVVAITAGVDIQSNRIELDRFGWTANEQCYGLGKIVIHGDPTGLDIWEELDNILKTPLRHELLGEMSIMATGVDSGYLTQQVGRFCRPRWGQRIWALKGVSGMGRPIWQKSPNKLKKLNLNFFLVGADQAKETIYSRLKIDDVTVPGYCHFNMSYDKDHFQQLTSEEVVTSYKKGIPVRSWKLKEGFRRNEALDMMVYALAALEGLRIMGFSLRRKHKQIIEKYEPKETKPITFENLKNAEQVSSLKLTPEPERKPKQIRKRRRVVRMI